MSYLDRILGKHSGPRAQKLDSHGKLESSMSIENPRVKSATTLKFTLPEIEGRELSPGKSMMFHIPKEFAGRVVRDVILQHRKAEKYRNAGTEKWDPHGAYSRVELHDPVTGEWVKWKDPAGYSADKYAEWRSSSDPEHEVLHDWLAMAGEVKPDMVRVTNVGEHKTQSTSQIHDLEVVFYPEAMETVYQERIYTPGTSFIDIEQNKLLPSYGGGEHTSGVYENSIVLNGSREPVFPTTKDPGPSAQIEQGKLIIDLEPGRNLVQVEVSVGDTEYREQEGRLGWAKLRIHIQRADGSIESCVDRANVPPQGVIAGGPLNSYIQPGDKLVIQSLHDTSYLMGWRLAYETQEIKTDQVNLNN